MSGAKTLQDTNASTSSPVSAAGRTPSDSPAGPPRGLFGQPLVPANPYRVPESAEVRRTNGTCGRNSTASSASVDLSQSLVNRLREAMDLNGSMEFRLIWRKSVMPSGRVCYRLVASARPISEAGYGGWPTVNASDR